MVAASGGEAEAVAAEAKKQAEAAAQKAAAAAAEAAMKAAEEEAAKAAAEEAARIEEVVRAASKPRAELGFVVKEPGVEATRMASEAAARLRAVGAAPVHSHIAVHTEAGFATAHVDAIEAWPRETREAMEEGLAWVQLKMEKHIRTYVAVEAQLWPPAFGTCCAVRCRV